MSHTDPKQKPIPKQEIANKHISGANVKKDESTRTGSNGGMIGEAELGRTGGMKDEAF